MCVGCSEKNIERFLETQIASCRYLYQSSIYKAGVEMNTLLTVPSAMSWIKDETANADLIKMQNEAP